MTYKCRFHLRSTFGLKEFRGLLEQNNRENDLKPKKLALPIRLPGLSGPNRRCLAACVAFWVWDFSLKKNTLVAWMLQQEKNATICHFTLKWARIKVKVLLFPVQSSAHSLSYKWFFGAVALFCGSIGLSKNYYQDSRASLAQAESHWLIRP